MTLGPDEALLRARRLLDADDGPVAGAGADAVALAWALKELCYAAWSTEPPRAARAADALRRLQQAGVGPAQAAEVDALVQWTAGIACLTRGQMADAVRAFDRAAAAFRGAGLPDPAAQTQVPKIMALSMLGQHADATACAEAAQRELLALGNLSVAARVSQNLGSLHLRRDAYAEAARHYRDAAALFERLGDARHGVLADIGMADALAAMGDFDAALRIYARSGASAAEQSLHASAALVDEAVARVHLARGDYRAALAGLESARRRDEALAMPHVLAIAEKHLGDAYLELRLLPEALAVFSTAVDRFGALELPDEQAWALAQRGRAQALLGQPAAAASFTAAADLFSAQGNTVGTAAVALARAELALASGHPADALAAADAAAAGFAAAAQADGSARAEAVRAQALLAAGRAAEAGAVFDATLSRARELGQVQLQVRCLTGQGLLAKAAGHDEQARMLFDAAIELFEDQRRALPGDEMRSAFLTDHLRPYHERLRMALAAAAAARPAGSGDAEVLRQLDRFRARALGERPAGVAPQAPEPDDVSALRARLNWLYSRVQSLQDEGDTSETLAAEVLRTERDLLERARRQRLAAAPRESPAVAGAGFSVAALCAALQDGDALVEYGAIDDELFACVATRRGVVAVRHLASWGEVLEAVRSARFQIDTLRHGAAPVQQHLATLTARMQARLARLHALVWAPLAAALHGCGRVLLVPNGPLAALPFAALQGDGGVPLGQRVELALAVSASAALRGLALPPLPARVVLALGESSRLPHAAREALLVAGLFAQGRAFVGEQATLQTLRAHAGAADVLHFACHAQFRADNPRFSALHLHGDVLTVELAESLALRPCTVVLSACESGLAEVDIGDENLGLVRAFQVAGAARVVASLWPVDDAATAAFMARFYGALVRGGGHAAALASAQAQTLREQPHPYFWAAFTLHGGW